MSEACQLFAGQTYVALTPLNKSLTASFGFHWNGPAMFAMVAEGALYAPGPLIHTAIGYPLPSNTFCSSVYVA